MRKLIKVLILPVLLTGGYFFGPQTAYPALDPKVTPFAGDLAGLPEMIRRRERSVPNLRPDNEGRIIWADSARQTPYSLVFLHGFSASSREGYPIASDFARRYGCNLYLPRLAQHGIDDPDSFRDLTPGELLDSAKEALAIGKRLGEKVIVMGSSTGCTLAAYLTAENPGLVDALIFYSPNIALGNDLAFLLTKPWGAALNRAVHGGNYRTWEPEKEKIKDYWTTTYHIRGVLALQALIEETMRPEVFQKIDVPVFTGYYFKNEKEKDEVVSIDAIFDFMQAVSTPEAKQRLVVFPQAGAHVLSCDLQSKDIEGVRQQTFAFAEEVLGLSRTRYPNEE